jgi:hypothetical protein
LHSKLRLVTATTAATTTATAATTAAATAATAAAAATSFVLGHDAVYDFAASCVQTEVR